MAKLIVGGLIAVLAFAGPAAASTLRVTATHGDIVISTHQDPGVYRTTVYVPGAYWLNANAHVAGPASVTVTTPTGPRTLTGRVHPADPRTVTGNSCAADKGYSHLAVWVLALGRVQIPVYVDPSIEGTTALTWCASRATRMHVTSVRFTLDPVFAVQHGTYVWHALFDNGDTFVARARVRQ